MRKRFESAHVCAQRGWVLRAGLSNVGMESMILANQVKKLVAKAVQEATGNLQDQMREMPEALAQAKGVIAKLQTALYGTKAETSAVVPTDEGQQVMELTLKNPSIQNYPSAI